MEERKYKHRDMGELKLDGGGGGGDLRTLGLNSSKQNRKTRHLSLLSWEE